MITAIIVAGVLGLVGALVGAGVSASNSEKNYQAQKEANEANLRSVRETNQANKELQELSYQQNIEQWNRENEYNLPANQMKRFEDAGLNPNLIYSQSSTSASSPTMTYSPMRAGQVVPAMRQNVDLSGVVNSLMALPNLIKEMQLMPYQIETAKNQAQQSTIATKFYEEQITSDLAFKRLTQDELIQKIAGLKLGNQSYPERFRAEMDRINTEIKSMLKKNDLMAAEITGRNLSNDALRLSNSKSELELGNYMTEFDKRMRGLDLDNALKELNLSLGSMTKGKQAFEGNVFNKLNDFMENPFGTYYKYKNKYYKNYDLNYRKRNSRAGGSW